MDAVHAEARRGQRSLALSLLVLFAFLVLGSGAWDL